MARRSKTARARLLCGSALASVTLWASAASAQDIPEINIPPQSLASALYTFAGQSGHQVMFSPDLTGAKTTAGVAGVADREQALAQLLQGSGLTFQREDDTFLIVRADDPQSGSAAGDGADGTVEALIVTAQKREEDIQDVPIAISAFSQEALETHQIAGGPDLITQVPNMTFTKTNFSSYSIQIRGIGTQAISATTDPGVAVAFNNTPFIRNRFFEQEFYDLQRVEVLRGPQGTLYGRNATAGVVNIISAKPKFMAEAKLGADVTNYNSTRLEGMVNIPLVEDIAALRIAGAWTKREGYATNEITGQQIDGRDLWSTRVSLRVTPSDRLDMNLIWEHFEEDDDRIRSGKQLCKKHIVTQVGGRPVKSFDQTLAATNQQLRHIAVQPRFSQGCIRESLYSPESFQTPNGASVPYYVPLSAIGLPAAGSDPYSNLFQSRDLRVIESTIDPEYRAEADLGELQVSYDITDNLTVASETAYSTDFVYSLQDFNRFNTAPGAWDANLGAANWAVQLTVLSPDGVFCDPQLGCSDRLVAVDVSTAKSRHFSQEFRLSSDFEGPFNFNFGANFLRYDTEDKYYVFINSLTFVAAMNDVIVSLYSASNPYQVGVSDNHECLEDHLSLKDPSEAYGYRCVYIETNSIADIQDQGHNYFLSKNPYKLISYAMFGEAYYEIADNLKITAGLRYTVDKKRAPRIPSWALVGQSVGYPVMEVIEQEWREPTGRLAIDWKPELSFTDETMIYGSFAHGYKAGGANPPPLVNPLDPATFGGTAAGFVEFASATRPKTFDAEFVDAFELGAKNTLADGRVTLNLAAFYYDYTGYQISEIVDRSAFNQNFDAEVWGLEIEADWRPLENLKFGFKGGYENTRLKDGERAIDLMDRTAGKEDWIVIRPFPTSPSSCVLPTFLFVPPGIEGDPLDIADLGGGGGAASGGCEFAYLLGHDPVTNLPYVPFPTVEGVSSPTLSFWPTGAYPGWDPTDESQGHNHGEGFFKELGGNQLPNAPNYTATLTVDYTLPLPNDWLATLHTDLYWQSESWWRIFNDHEYNKLDQYFTANIAAIFANEDAGWRVMAYVKNVFDRDSITGAFLNSDDTALTTNVFLTEPRLYGLRITKDWNGGPLLGSFGSRRNGPYPFTLELGGQTQRHDAPNAILKPDFSDAFSGPIDPLPEQEDDLDWGDGRDVKLTYQAENGWKAALGVHIGKANRGRDWVRRQVEGDKVCPFAVSSCQYYTSIGTDAYGRRSNYSIADTFDREDHTVVDFMVGKDIGMGLFDRSTVMAGLRHAELTSTTSAHIYGSTNWDIPIDGDAFFNKYDRATHDRYDAQFDADRGFKGLGPMLSWEAAKALLGNADIGHLGMDWSIDAGVLFGDRETTVTGEQTSEHYDQTVNTLFGISGASAPVSTAVLPPVSRQSSESVTVPVLGLGLGLSYSVDRFRIGAGYRWERYFDAIDGGFREAKDVDRTIDGPYFKLSVGFGG